MSSLAYLSSHLFEGAPSGRVSRSPAFGSKGLSPHTSQETINPNAKTNKAIPPAAIRRINFISDPLYSIKDICMLLPVAEDARPCAYVASESADGLQRKLAKK